MKTTFLFAIVASALGLGFVAPPADKVGSSDGATCSLQNPEYVGAKSCKACHFAQHTSWKKTEMSKAFETLKPGQKAEAKTRHGLDPQKDYTKDPTCVACHTTGYGKPGGYPAIVEGKEWTDDEKKRATEMEGVQCEACHGPGSLTGPYKKEHEDFKKADVLALGMIEPKKENCEGCHNTKSPTIAKDYVLDYDAMTKDADKIHKHVPLKNKH